MSEVSTRSAVPQLVAQSVAPGLPLPVVGADLQVPLVTGATVRYTNLDYAASAPSLAAVAETLQALLPWYSSVHRGAGFASQATTAVYDAARDTVRRFVGGRPDDAVVFVRNTTDALNLLASVLPAGTTVVTFASEHHANLLPWRRRHRVTHLPVLRTPQDCVHEAAEALAAAPPGPRVLSVAGASNVTGELWPLEALGEVARRHGARFVLDAAQLAAHRAIDIAALGVDYVAFSGHKLYAPFGAGALVGRGDWLDAGEPYLAGGGAVASVTLDSVDWASGSDRHEAGTPNVLGAATLAAACSTLHEVGMDRLADHEEHLLQRLLAGLDGILGLQRYDLWGPASDRIGLVTFSLAGVHHSLVAAALSAEFGIGVRDGAFCAHPLVASLIGQQASCGSAGSGAVRVSFGAGTREDDIDRFVVALTRLATSGPAHTYRLEGARYVPDPDPRALPRLPGLPEGTTSLPPGGCTAPALDTLSA